MFLIRWDRPLVCLRMHSFVTRFTLWCAAEKPFSLYNCYYGPRSRRRIRDRTIQDPQDVIATDTFLTLDSSQRDVLISKASSTSAWSSSCRQWEQWEDEQLAHWHLMIIVSQNRFHLIDFKNMTSHWINSIFTSPTNQWKYLKPIAHSLFNINLKKK